VKIQSEMSQIMAFEIPPEEEDAKAKNNGSKPGQDGGEENFNG
jgi:hypothetical protein